ncbi:MAG: hypothetical protein MJZ34_04330 [Paludibacteraceae bacterium]|nr:hypothetical protein [Paludibacteraceae bacterium]
MDELGFGEDKEMINFILKNISQENKKKVTSEVIETVLDFMLDYYESKGFLSDDKDGDEEIEIDEIEMSQFIKDKLSHTSFALTDNQIDEILDLEYQYNQEEGIYD